MSRVRRQPPAWRRNALVTVTTRHSTNFPRPSSLSGLVLRIRTHRLALPIIMIVTGMTILLFSVSDLLHLCISPRNMHMRAQVTWIRYRNKFALPTAQQNFDVLRRPLPATRENRSWEEHQVLTNRPIAMIGVFMMDTPQAVFARKILRLVFPASDVLLRFVICRPTALTLLEADVLAVDMPENMNNGKSQRWFKYAAQNVPPSVEAIFKMDDDSMICWPCLREAIIRARRHKYAYYGRYIDHAECGEYVYCPPRHCMGNIRFQRDCYYYMQGGLYGFSPSLLKQIWATPSFQQDQDMAWHEDIMAGLWINQTDVRTSVVEVPLWFYHEKALIEVDPPEYENIVNAYGRALWELECAREYVEVTAELDKLYHGAVWYSGLSRRSF